MKTSEITKGMKVKFEIGGRWGVTRGKGAVTKGCSDGGTSASARITVKDAEGREWHPYASQCTVVKN